MEITDGGRFYPSEETSNYYSLVLCHKKAISLFKVIHKTWAQNSPFKIHSLYYVSTKHYTLAHNVKSMTVTSWFAFYKLSARTADGLQMGLNRG